MRRLTKRWSCAAPAFLIAGVFALGINVDRLSAQQGQGNSRGSGPPWARYYGYKGFRNSSNPLAILKGGKGRKGGGQFGGKGKGGRGGGQFGKGGKGKGGRGGGQFGKGGNGGGGPPWARQGGGQFGKGGKGKGGRGGGQFGKGGKGGKGKGGRGGGQFGGRGKGKGGGGGPPWARQQTGGLSTEHMKLMQEHLRILRQLREMRALLELLQKQQGGKK